MKRPSKSAFTEEEALINPQIGLQVPSRSQSHSFLTAPVILDADYLASTLIETGDSEGLMLFAISFTACSKAGSEHNKYTLQHHHCCIHEVD